MPEHGPFDNSDPSTISVSVFEAFKLAHIGAPEWPLPHQMGSTEDRFLEMIDNAVSKTKASKAVTLDQKCEALTRKFMRRSLNLWVDPS